MSKVFITISWDLRVIKERITARLFFAIFIYTAALHVLLEFTNTLKLFTKLYILSKILKEIAKNISKYMGFDTI